MNLPLQHKRIVSVDILRGIVMVIMALDHARDYFTNYHDDPTDVAHAGTAMFFTRWITHYCAPIFIFLSGTSAYLSSVKGKTKKETATFLLSRGIWMLILEFTLIRFGWQFNFDYSQLFVQVIWAIGWSMICLAGLVFLPLPAILGFGLLLIFGHNILDSIHAERFGDNAIWWNFLHEFGNANVANGVNLMIIYPVVPWIGVMATGYCFGTIIRKEQVERNKWLYSIGISAIFLFMAIRYTNAYGDPFPWEEQPTTWRTFLSFINCTKYPPSLLYLLMTIGPGILALPLLEKMHNAVGRFFMIFGRVPMFYYILHIYLIHGMALVLGLMMSLPVAYFTEGFFGPKPGWGFSLPMVYVFWITAVLLLYLPCRWIMYIKMNHKKWWLSYL